MNILKHLRDEAQGILCQDAVDHKICLNTAYSSIYIGVNIPCGMKRFQKCALTEKFILTGIPALVMHAFTPGNK